MTERVLHDQSVSVVTAAITEEYIVPVEDLIASSRVVRWTPHSLLDKWAADMLAEKTLTEKLLHLHNYFLNEETFAQQLHHCIFDRPGNDIPRYSLYSSICDG
jgi:hypothetical protein